MLASPARHPEACTHVHDREHTAPCCSSISKLSSWAAALLLRRHTHSCVYIGDTNAGLSPMTDQGCVMILRAHMNLQRKHLEDVQMCEGSCSPGKTALPSFSCYSCAFSAAFHRKLGLPTAWCRRWPTLAALPASCCKGLEMYGFPQGLFLLFRYEGLQRASRQQCATAPAAAL